jgi:hypothetical protein
LGLALGELHWSAEAFWTATPHELHAAVEWAAEAADPLARQRARFAAFAAQFVPER